MCSVAANARIDWASSRSQLGAAVLALLFAFTAGSASAFPIDSCEKQVYLTFNSGTMEGAPQVADVLWRHRVRATFFVSNGRTQVGDGSLGNYWAPWWKTRGAQGHEFASLTYDHVLWRGDLSGNTVRFRMRPTAGAFAGREFTWEAAKYCGQVDYAAQRLFDFTGKKALPLFRAPGGATSPALLAAAQACGYAHVGWTTTAVLADALPVEPASRDAALQHALGDIRSGDILTATLGVPGRQDAWALSLLEPLIVGLKARGFCFDTLRTHPAFKDWTATHGK